MVWFAYKKRYTLFPLKFILKGVDKKNILDKITWEDKMKIVSWNCKMIPPYNKEGFTENKVRNIEKYGADIYVIQECTNHDVEQLKKFKRNSVWYGDNLDSKYGLGLFSDIFNIKLLEEHNPEFRYIIPYKIFDKNNEFTLFSVWIKPVEGNYEKPLYDGVEYYRNKKMLDNHSIFIGDFNTFAKDDKTLQFLEKKMQPLINCTKNTSFWKTPTYYHARNNMGLDDFCFVSEDIINKFKIDVNIPDEWDDAEDKDHHWKGLSDHSPIIVDIK
jgi:endonuclease/exonuclease/phosphatase family metal-dependent hydrolase